MYNDFRLEEELKMIRKQEYILTTLYTIPVQKVINAMPQLMKGELLHMKIVLLVDIFYIRQINLKN